MKNAYIAFLSAVAVLAICLFIGSNVLDARCEAAGGERLRPMLGGWKCYDKASLREVKP